MATKNKIKLEFSGFKEMAEKLDKINGDLKKTSEEALLKSKTVVTQNLLKVTNKSNYPAHGKYSHGGTRHSIDTDKNVNWQGSTASIPVGFDMTKSGLTSIFLMYGTPKMPKVQPIYDAVYGSKTKSQIKKIQQEIFAKAIKEKMEG